MHPVTVIVFAKELLLLCGVVCAATPTDRIMAAAADAPDRTIVFMLPPLFQEPSGTSATLRPGEYGGAIYARGPCSLEKSSAWIFQFFVDTGRLHISFLDIIAFDLNR